ncbi:calcium-dependent protein kinase 32-like [Papaver somniferum]|uniref:calcium-dependent protein kinase 32-like n=1 Tax=Papaver somniferum TaxID=3469 RepID=UPI000E6FCD0E|nr:calcium-dependent protein kinase 32-like [Papaver somniferum]
MDLENGKNKQFLEGDSETPREICDGKYLVGCEIGRGGFGIVYRCIDKETNQAYACKCILLEDDEIGDNDDGDDGVDDDIQEVYVMRNIRHPNIVGLKDVHVAKESIQIVMELCEGGNLYDRMAARGPFLERTAANLFKTVVQVIDELHRHGIMHRDMKPQNLLLVDENEDSVLKVSDFGLSVCFEYGEKFDEVVGDIHYLAPEIINKNYGPEADIWSAGVILYTMLSGYNPWSAHTYEDTGRLILKGELDLSTYPWPKISKSGKKLIRKVLVHDPSKRLTAQQILVHPWLRTNANN